MRLIHKHLFSKSSESVWRSKHCLHLCSLHHTLSVPHRRQLLQLGYFVPKKHSGSQCSLGCHSRSGMFQTHTYSGSYFHPTNWFGMPAENTIPVFKTCSLLIESDVKGQWSDGIILATMVWKMIIMDWMFMSASSKFICQNPTPPCDV